MGFRSRRSPRASFLCAASLLAGTPLSFDLLEQARLRDSPPHNLLAVETVSINGEKPETYQILWQNGEKLRKSNTRWERMEEARARTNASFAFGKWSGLDGRFKLHPPKREGDLWMVRADGHLAEWTRQRRRYWLDAGSGRLRRFECEIVRDGGPARKGSVFRYEFDDTGLVSYSARFALAAGPWTNAKGTITGYQRFTSDSKILVQ